MNEPKHLIRYSELPEQSKRLGVIDVSGLNSTLKNANVFAAYRHLELAVLLVPRHAFERRSTLNAAFVRRIERWRRLAEVLNPVVVSIAVDVIQQLRRQAFMNEPDNVVHTEVATVNTNYAISIPLQRSRLPWAHPWSPPVQAPISILENHAHRVGIQTGDLWCASAHCAAVSWLDAEFPADLRDRRLSQLQSDGDRATRHALSHKTSNLVGESMLSSSTTHNSALRVEHAPHGPAAQEQRQVLFELVQHAADGVVQPDQHRHAERRQASEKDQGESSGCRHGGSVLHLVEVVSDRVDFLGRRAPTAGPGTVGPAALAVRALDVAALSNVVVHPRRVTVAGSAHGRLRLGNELHGSPLPVVRGKPGHAEQSRALQETQASDGKPVAHGLGPSTRTRRLQQEPASDGPLREFRQRGEAERRAASNSRRCFPAETARFAGPADGFEMHPCFHGSGRPLFWGGLADQLGPVVTPVVWPQFAATHSRERLDRRAAVGRGLAASDPIADGLNRLVEVVGETTWPTGKPDGPRNGGFLLHAAKRTRFVYSGQRFVSGRLHTLFMDDPFSVWERVDAELTRRRQRHLTPGDWSTLGKQIEVTKQVLSNWKSRGVSRQSYQAVADALGWSIDELLGRDSTQPSGSVDEPVMKRDSSLSLKDFSVIYANLQEHERERLTQLMVVAGLVPDAHLEVIWKEKPAHKTPRRFGDAPGPDPVETPMHQQAATSARGHKK